MVVTAPRWPFVRGQPPRWAPNHQNVTNWILIIIAIWFGFIRITNKIYHLCEFEMFSIQSRTVWVFSNAPNCTVHSYATDLLLLWCEWPSSVTANRPHFIKRPYTFVWFCVTNFDEAFEMANNRVSFLSIDCIDASPSRRENWLQIEPVKMEYIY